MNNGSQDMPMEQMPPMDMQPPMGNDMGGDFMPQGNMQQPPMNGEEMPNQFDTNFDPGVEADEEQDPKKFIQQLTGKLSQSLQKYTDNNGQPDLDLNKYVAGMIIKQAIKGLSQDDADEIIDKVKADEDFNPDGDNANGEQQEPQMADNPPQDQNMMPQDGMQQPPMNEGFSKFRKQKQIKEIVNGVLNDYKEDTPKKQEPKNTETYKKGAYMSPF